MNEQNIDTQAPVQQPEIIQPAPQTPVAQTSAGAYATFWARLVAALIDSILLGVALSILASLLGMTGEDGSNPFGILGLVYYVLMTYKFGATLGKMAMNIAVRHEDGSSLSLVDVLLREVVGKFLSTIVFALGYFWMIWDPKKQTWHDKLAKSVVVKTK